jgi:transcriptional regulator GlxA family with amidase domain
MGSRRPAAGPPRRIAMLIYPGVAPLDVAGPLQVFGVCNFLKGETLYDVVTVAPTPDPVRTPVGITFLPDLAMDDLAMPVDTLLVSGGGGPSAGATEQIGVWLRKAAPQARRFGSICTGAFALGAAGLIDGRRVTTHWAFAGKLAEIAPAATVDADAIYIRDGSLYTSAGITSGIDLALALVEEDHGRDLALMAARFLVLYLKRSGGQAQFSTQLRAQFSDVPGIHKAQAWCLDNLHGDLSVPELARRAGMSARNFARLFARETGTTPKAFVAGLRMEAACRLLDGGSHSLQAVAARCGYGTPTKMRRAFLSAVGVTPALYRARFGAAEAIPDAAVAEMP